MRPVPAKAKLLSMGAVKVAAAEAFSMLLREIFMVVPPVIV
jgi:hypothetical protein